MNLGATIIETERLVLRHWKEDDVDGLMHIYADPQHARFIGGEMKRSSAWRMLASFIGHHALRGYTLMAIEEKATGAFLGWAGPWFPEGWPEREIGYTLVPSATGKGFAAEAVTASLRYAYNNLGWDTAVSNIDADNAASQKVARNLGAEQEAIGVQVTQYTVDLWRHLPPKQFRERFA